MNSTGPGYAPVQVRLTPAWTGRDAPRPGPPTLSVRPLPHPLQDVIDVALGFAPPTGAVSAAAAAFSVDDEEEAPAAPAPKAPASASASTPGGPSARTFGKASYAPAKATPAAPAAPAAPARAYPGASGITPGVSQVGVWPAGSAVR